jgi:hypothetical protein
MAGSGMTAFQTGTVESLPFARLVFMEQRAEGLNVWENPLIPLRFPKLFDLRADPFEKAQTDAGNYARWRVERAFRARGR